MEEDVNLKAFDGYDEDLNENSFFKYIQTKHRSFYDEAAKRRWIICVPRKGTLSRTNHTLKDVENHFLQLIQGEGSQSYSTLNGKRVKVNEGFIFTEKGFEDVKYVRILFEETFFNGRNESYQVLCLDQPLEGGIGVSADPVVQALDNLQGCIDFLWPSTATKQGQKQIDEIMRLFNSTYQQLAGESLRHLMDAANAIYTRAMQAALKNSQLQKLSHSNKSYLDNVKLAIETYVMHGLYNQLMKGISSIIGNEDAALNKITRNLADIQIRDLGIKPEICINLPRGRRALSFLNRFTSPLEKFHCLKKSITLITERKIKNKDSGAVNAITADDLLPALVFLVIKSDIPNWLANITFLHNFHFSKCGYNEFQFYLSSLEAAVEHVRSGSISNEFKGGAPFKRLPNGVAGSYSLWQPIGYDGNKPTALDMLFEYTAQGNEQEVEKLLGNEEEEILRLDKMCHPLCSCDMCEKLLSRKRNDPSAVTVFSRDDMGRTILHVAAEYGHANLTYSLIHKGGVVNTMDYHGSTPLHMACLRGHSKVVLILLHYKADTNAIDNDGNTPMHLCVANGHDKCCKSLVYSDMHHHILKINVANENGDTPLHLAARWGYVDLVDLLIERGASTEARNKNKQTALDCAYSQQVSEMILDATASQLEKETGFLAFLPDEEVKNSLRSHHVPIKCSTRSSLAGSPASSLERHSPKEVDVFLRTVADGDIEMVRFRLSLDEEDEEDGSDIQCKSEKDLCHPLCQCDKCIKWQKLTSRSPEHSIHVNCNNKDGVTPLHVAAVRGFTAIANLLLRHGADPNAKDYSKQHTPLHLACQYNHHEVAELLLNYSAKISIKDYKGNTPLHFCCINGHLAPALVLLERNVNVDVPNDRGNTPLHEAARWNFSELVRVLLEHGACANVRNKSQLTPMQYGKHDDVMKVLEQSDKIAHESGLKRRKGWAGLSLSSNLKEVSLPNPVESLGTSPNPPQPIHQKSSTAPIRVSYSNVTKTVELEEHPRLRSLTETSLCDTTIEQPQTKLNKIFEHLEHGEMEKLQEIVKAVRAFDRRKSLKRAVTIDKSLPYFDFKVDHDVLDEFDQNILCNDDLFNQPIIHPNNITVEPEPCNSGPLLDRVRKVLLDDPSYRAGYGPLLERVHTVLTATEQIKPANNYEANVDSIENLSEKKSRRGDEVEEVISEVPVVESAHPELVFIVQREITVLNRAKESDGNLVKTFEAESGCLEGNEVIDADETLHSVDSGLNHPETENFENFSNRGDFYEEVQRDKDGCSTKGSASLRTLEDENTVNLEEVIEKGMGAAENDTGVRDLTSSSCDVCRSKDCQHDSGDNFNQNNNVDCRLTVDDDLEHSPREPPNDYYDSRSVSGPKNIQVKVECELIAESAPYEIETTDIPDDFIAKLSELRKKVKTHETSTDGQKSSETYESSTVPIKCAKNHERSNDPIESEKTRKMSTDHYRSGEKVETSTEHQDSSTNDESTFQESANRAPERVETGEFVSNRSLESNITFETSHVHNVSTVMDGDCPQKFMVSLETAKTVDPPESAEKRATSIGFLAADKSCETSTGNSDSAVEERNYQLEISSDCEESTFKTNRPKSVQSDEILNKRENPPETAKTFELSFESDDLPETDKNRKTPWKSDNSPEPIKNAEILDKSCELDEALGNQEKLRNSEKPPESVKFSEILTERVDLQECGEKKETSRERESLPESVETRKLSIDMSSDLCEDDTPNECVEIHQTSTSLKSSDNLETSTSNTDA